MSRLFLASVVGIGLLSQVAYTGDAKKAPPRTDAEFLQAAAACHNAEIQLGRVAVLKASDDKVKEFAGRVVKDHQAAYDDLAKLLKNRNLGIITGLEKDNRDDAQRLIGATGAEFDQLFVAIMVRHHEKAEADYDAHARTTEQADIREHARATLPVIRQHLKDARQLQTNSSK